MAGPTRGVGNGLLVAHNHPIRLPDPTDRVAAELPRPKCAVAVVECEELALRGCAERVEGAGAGVFVCSTLEQWRFREEGAPTPDHFRSEDAAGVGAAAGTEFVGWWGGHLVCGLGGIVASIGIGINID